MFTLEMTDEEAKIVKSVLENYRSHLEVEIHRTYKRDFRKALEERGRFLDGIIERFKTE
jgi:hypothetical protein